MKFRKILLYECGYQLRQVSTWLYSFFLLGLAFLIVVGNYLPDARDGYFLLNAPGVIASVTAICSVKWLLVGASIPGEAAARDIQSRMHPLVYSAPVSKLAYLGGKFFAAFVLQIPCLLAVPAGVLLAVYCTGVEAEMTGPFRADAYVTAFGFIALPNAFFATAIQYGAAVCTRSSLGSFLAATALFAVAYAVWPLLPEIGKWGALADPMSFGPVLDYLSDDWSLAEKNNRLLSLDGPFLANRIVWFCVSLMVLAFTYASFKFSSVQVGHRTGNIAEPALTARQPVRWEAGNALPETEQVFDLNTSLRQLRAVTWRAFLLLAKSKAGALLLAVLAMILGATISGNLKGKGVPLLPRTDFVLELLAAPLTGPETFWIILALLTLFYAGELVWYENEVGLHEIASVAPVAEWILFTGRFFGLALMLVIWLFLVMITGIVAQSALGAARIETGLYVQVLFGLQLTECLLFAVLALVVHVLVNHKYLGHLTALLCYGWIAFAPTLGIEHKLLIFSASPAWTYTDMAGFGPSLWPWFWFKAYWSAWALFLASIAILFWSRSREGSPVKRFELARRRFRGPLKAASGLAFCGVLGTGGFIFYNTHILREYTSTSDALGKKARYEQRFRKYMDLPQPRLTHVKLAVEIHPRERSAQIRGTYILVNDHAKPVYSIHLAEGLKINKIAFGRPAMLLLADSELGQRIYALKKPLQPGNSMQVRFEIEDKPQGFSNNGADTRILASGTRIGNAECLPAIGYQPYRELDEAGTRKAHRLAPRPETASVYDAQARMYAPFSERVSFEAVVGTDTGQTAIAPGSLRKSWKKGGRHYFHYATDAPIRNEYFIFSAEYALQKHTWHNRAAGSSQEVSVEIFYPKGFTQNARRMLLGAMASLDYYTKQFGPYQHKQLRFVAHPGYGFGNHASPVNITAEEGFFLLNPNADPRGFDLVTAVVAHETSHQWWGGNMLLPAYVEGAGLLTESLAWYSALGVLEDRYGPKQLQEMLAFLREEHEAPRTRAALPLVQATNWYQMYRKGPLALYTLSQYVGREHVNGALRHLLRARQPGTLPLPTSLDLYEALHRTTPDSLKTLLHDLLKANTFWEVKVKSVLARHVTGQEWQVELELESKKLTVDSMGNETGQRMAEWIEIGIFGAGKVSGEPGRQIYLQKHLIHSGQQKLLITLTGEPAELLVDPRMLLTDTGMQSRTRIGRTN